MNVLRCLLALVLWLLALAVAAPGAAKLCVAARELWGSTPPSRFEDLALLVDKAGGALVWLLVAVLLVANATLVRMLGSLRNL
jgi:hypothetical protein